MLLNNIFNIEFKLICWLSKVDIMEGEEVVIFWDYENIRTNAQKSQVPMAESLLSYSKTSRHHNIL